MAYADPTNPYVQVRIIELFKAGKYPEEIQAELNLKYHQPIYNLLKRWGVYVRRPARSNRKHIFAEDFFAEINSEGKAYFLGLLAADGCIFRSQPVVAFQCHRKDKDVLEKLVRAVDGKPEMVVDITHAGQTHSKVRLNSARMKADLMAKGVRPAKSLTMTGEVFGFVPDRLKSHFLRGYFDGDGNVFLKFNTLGYGTKTSINVIGTKDFLEATFGECCVSNCKLAKHRTSNIWHWKVSSHSQVFAFLAHIYKDATIYLDRKYKYVVDAVGLSAHVKPSELLETLTSRVEGNQQPSGGKPPKVQRLSRKGVGTSVPKR